MWWWGSWLITRSKTRADSPGFRRIACSSRFSHGIRRWTSSGWFLLPRNHFWKTGHYIHTFILQSSKFLFSEKFFLSFPSFCLSHQVHSQAAETLHGISHIITLLKEKEVISHNVYGLNVNMYKASRKTIGKPGLVWADGSDNEIVKFHISLSSQPIFTTIFLSWMIFLNLTLLVFSCHLLIL